MKISQLIAELQIQLSQHGDLDVELDDRQGQGDPVRGILHVPAMPELHAIWNKETLRIS